MRKLQGYSHAVFDETRLHGYASMHSLKHIMNKSRENKPDKWKRILGSSEKIMSVLQTCSFWGSQYYFLQIFKALKNGDELPLILHAIIESRLSNTHHHYHHEIPQLEEIVKKKIVENILDYYDNTILQYTSVTN